jgi:hypothetical protein
MPPTVPHLVCQHRGLAGDVLCTDLPLEPGIGRPTKRWRRACLWKCATGELVHSFHPKDTRGGQVKGRRLRAVCCHSGWFGTPSLRLT